MALDTISIGGDDMEQELLPRLERSFGIRFDRDLRHVQTAGDLYREILAKRASGGQGSGEPVSMAFYAIRRGIAPFWQEPSAAPGTVLRGRELPSPRFLAKRLARETGYEMPPLSASMAAWLFALTLAAIGLLVLVAGEQQLVGVSIFLTALIPLKLDPGEYSGDWETLGSLTKAVTELNFANLADAGARDTDANAWAAFASTVTRYAFDGMRIVDPREIGPETRFRYT